MEIRWFEEALDDLDGEPVFWRRTIATEVFLLRERPDTEEGRKKMIAGLIPPWSEVPADFWQLSVGHYRVWYDVDRDEDQVRIFGVIDKRPHETTAQTMARLFRRRIR